MNTPPTTPRSTIVAAQPAKDDADVSRLLGTLRMRSASAAPVVDAALASGVAIRVVDDAAIDQADPNLMGQYDPGTHMVWLRRSMLGDERQALQTLAHELLHAVDRGSGHDAVLRLGMSAAYEAAGWRPGPALDRQVRYHSGLVREARAYVLASQVRRELGFEPRSEFHRTISAGATESDAYVAAWEQLEHRYRSGEPGLLRDVPITYMPGSGPLDPA